jgi:hypothetical protein
MLDLGAGTHSAKTICMAVIGAILLGWLAFNVMFVIVWSRMRAHERALRGLDEEAYVNGRYVIVAKPSAPAPRGRVVHGRRLTLQV